LFIFRMFLEPMCVKNFAHSLTVTVQNMVMYFC
jgi:hypothetical protein